MAKKKKKQNTLLFLLLVLAVATLGYFALCRYNETLEATEEEEEEESETLLSLSGTISRISYEYEGERITLVLDENDSWVREDDTEFPITQSYVTSMVSALSEASVQREITTDETADLSEYGLDTPIFAISVEDDEVTSQTIILGNIYSTVGGIYALLAGETRVVLTGTSLGTCFAYGWMDLISVDSAPSISTTQIVSITMEQGKETREIVYLSDGLPSVDYTESSTLFWHLSDDSYLPIYTTTGSTLLSVITGLSYDSVAVYQASSKELESYGLTSPTAVITVNYTEDVTETTETTDEDGETTETSVTVTYDRVYILTIGSYDEDSNIYYVMVEGSASIFTMDASDLDTLLTVTVAQTANLSPNNITDSTVDQIIFTMDDKTLVLAIERTEVDVETEEADDEESTEEETETQVIYLLDGEEISATDFQTIWSLLGITAERVLEEDEAVSELAAITVTYIRNSEYFSEITVEYIPYNSNYYQVSVNGEDPSVVVNIRDVENLMEIFDLTFETVSED